MQRAGSAGTMIGEVDGPSPGKQETVEQPRWLPLGGHSKSLNITVRKINHVVRAPGITLVTPDPKRDSYFSFIRSHLAPSTKYDATHQSATILAGFADNMMMSAANSL